MTCTISHLLDYFHSSSVWNSQIFKLFQLISMLAPFITMLLGIIGFPMFPTFPKSPMFTSTVATFSTLSLLSYASDVCDHSRSFQRRCFSAEHVVTMCSCLSPPRLRTQGTPHFSSSIWVSVTFTGSFKVAPQIPRSSLSLNVTMKKLE